MFQKVLTLVTTSILLVSCSSVATKNTLSAKAGHFDHIEEKIEKSGSKEINLSINEFSLGTEWAPAFLVIFCMDDYHNSLTFDLYRENGILKIGYKYTLNGRDIFFRNLNGEYKIDSPVPLQFQWNENNEVVFKFGKGEPIKFTTEFSANKIMYSMSSGNGTLERLQ